MDEADGQVKSLRIWLEEREVSYVPATSLGHDVFTPDGRNGRANEMIAAPPKQRPRIFAAPVFLCAGADSIAWTPGRGHWLPAKRRPVRRPRKP